ncbi:MAG: carboxylase [Rhodospirillaceae bacterium]|nr:carboxylase [Rhodospirillaceae bacterium]
MAEPKRGYPDLHDHIEALRKADLLIEIDEPINKDTEMHPLVRWQFRGGIDEADRKAFLFTNITDSLGRKYDLPVVIGALATNPEIYKIGVGCDLDKIGETWNHAIANPIKPNEVDDAPCHDVVETGADLIGEGKGLDGLPIPISTPGFDAAPYLTATNVITKDPETGIQNSGTYRAGLKASDRMAVRMVVRPGGAEGFVHWKKWKERGEPMPCAIVIGCPPAFNYMSPQKLKMGFDEVDVAGGLVGEPINVTKAKTIDLNVPAESEVVIEGLISTEYVEPEAPFGESAGYVALEAYNMTMQVTAITRRKNAVIPSIISQVTPSESSVIKRLAYEPLYLAHLRDSLGIQGVIKVSLHEPLTNLRKVVFVQMERGAASTEVWRALYGCTTLQSNVGKFIIAINDDIDPDNGDAVFWAMSYRCNPILDCHILEHRSHGQGPRVPRSIPDDSTLLIDATMKGPMPPLALPKKEYMEHAKNLWEKLGLPPLKPESPWHGYTLGDWSEEWDEAAKRAADGHYLKNGEISKQRMKKDIRPETPIRSDALDQNI